MVLEPKDVVINLIQGLNEPYYQLRHAPTGVETEPLPYERFHSHKDRLWNELEQKVAQVVKDLEELSLRPTDLEVVVGRRGDGDYAQIRHIPTKIQLEPMKLFEYNQNRRVILARLATLVREEQDTDSWNLYFPTEFLDTQSKISLQHYQRHLQGMHEVSFWKSSLDTDFHAYRFLWLRTFDPPLVVRLDLSSLKSSLTLKVTDGKGGYDPGRIVHRVEKDISQTQINRFLEQLDSLGFWQSQSDQVSGGIDGSSWILEGVKAGKFNFLDRWSPKPDDPFRIAMWSLVEMAGLEVEQVY